MKSAARESGVPGGFAPTGVSVLRRREAHRQEWRCHIGRFDLEDLGGAFAVRLGGLRAPGILGGWDRR
jgi:hypothetical protein